MFLEQQATRTDAIPVTMAAYESLEAELDLVLAEKREVADDLRSARQYGVGSNNDEHLAIREDEQILDARIGRLEDILRRAHIVGPGEAEDTIAIGSAITVVDCHSGTAIEYLIESPHCVTASNGVSAASPVGTAMLGRSRGSVVRVELPGGRQRRLEVLAVRPAAA
jgi:transcription elongation factor GreA